MTGASPPSREVERLALLHELQLPAAALVPGLEAIARMAARQTGCPIGTVSIVDADRQWLHAAHGVRRMEQPREHSFSAHAIAGDGLFEVPDVAVDPRFAGHPLLSAQPPTRFFAGMPVHVDGQRIGTVSVVDHRPRTLDADSRAALADLAAMAESIFEARLSELRRHARDDRNRAASRTGSDWLWETNADGVLVWISESVEQHTGWPASREIGEHNRRINRPPPGHLRASWERYRQARERHEPFREAIAERDSAHGPMLVAISGEPLFDAAGIFRGYIGSARDATSIVAEREQAQRSQQLLLKAIDDVRAGVMISGPDGRVLISNVAWRRKVGRYTRGEDLTWEQLVRRLVFQGVYPDAVGREEEFIAWRLAIASPEATLHEVRFADQDALVSDQRLPDGTVIHLSLDITERRRTEREMLRQRAELEASQARTAAVLRAVPDLWFVVDRDDRYLHCSDDRHPWLVLPFDEMRGQPFAFALPPHEARQSVAAVRAARQTGEVQRIEYELRTFDGLQRTFEARISPMPNGEVLYLTRDLTELRRLERDMQIMQRALEADAAVPMVVSDATVPDTPIIYANTAFERLTGYGRDEVLGRNCRFLQSGESNPAAREMLRRAIAAGESCTVALNNRRKDGSAFINELHIAPVRNAAGRLIQYIGVLNDVTDRVRDAERLRLSEDLYRSVAATISDRLLVISASGPIIACNPSACEMLGVEATRLIGQRFRTLGLALHDELDRPLSRAMHPVRKVLAGAAAVRDEAYQLHRTDGSVRTMLLTVSALNVRQDDGVPSCLVTFRDVTDRRVAEKALAEAEERWKFALESAGDGVWDNDEDSRRTFFSPRWKQMLGYADDEIGHSLREWADRVHPDDKDRVQAEILRYRSGAIPEYRTEHRLRHKDGRWIWVLDRGKIVARHPDGRPRRVVGTHTDITRLKEAEQALRDKQAAELASRAKSEFLSRMSHEMRTPLNAVIGFTQLLRLQTDGGPEKVAEYADHVLRAGEHLLALVNEVLDLQRVEEGKAVMQPEAVELAPLVAAALDLLQPMAQRHQIALSSQIPPDVWVHCDRRSLRQVLINVASNAVKYNRAGGWVCVSLMRAAPGRVSLAIEDTGSGLSDDQIARLFQPFERLGHESSDIEGSGLGLVIARALTQAMQGELLLSSVPGAGTLARLDLPAADSPDTLPGALDAIPPAATAGQGEPRATLRMLYVEDNRINALLFEEAMRLLGGWDLRIAEDGASALEAVDGWSPQVLVLDAHLPDMTGFEVLAHLRRRPELAEVPAFMCSADAMPEDIQRAHDAGFHGYWTKPIALESVSADLDALRASTAF